MSKRMAPAAGNAVVKARRYQALATAVPFGFRYVAPSGERTL